MVVESFDIGDLYRLQVQERCRISALYSSLVLSQEVIDMKLSCASHDWSLLNIQTICDDLLQRVPQNIAPANMYSKYFDAGNKETISILGDLSTALKRHRNICSRIELSTKGV